MQHVFVHLNLNQKTTMDLAIYSLNGCKAYAKSQFLPSCYTKFRIEKNGLARGQYIMKVVAGDESLQCPLLVW
jgi:hypothetical protein